MASLATYMQMCGTVGVTGYMRFRRWEQLQISNSGIMWHLPVTDKDLSAIDKDLPGALMGPDCEL